MKKNSAVLASGNVLRLVLEYAVWYTANLDNISVYDSLSIGSGPVAAVVLCVKREGRKLEEG